MARADLTRPAQGPRYSRVAIWLHWGIAAAVFGQLWLGFYMTGLAPGSMAQFSNYQLHKSIGITILLLTLLRLMWRLAHRPPPLPDHMPGWEKFAARSAHYGLYLLSLLIPLSGWALVSASPFNLPTVLFGWLPWPHIPGLQGFGDQKAVADGLSEAHEIMAFLLIALLLMHVAAALWHHWLLRDDVLTRMLPFGRKDGA